jgi:O-antigen ligase
VAFLFTGIEPKLGSVIVRPSDILLLILLGIEAAFSIDNRNGIPQVYGLKTGVTVMYLILVIYKFIDGVYKVDFKTSFEEFSQAFEYFLFYLLAIKYLWKYENREKFFKFLQICCLSIAIFTAFYHISMGKLTDYKEFDEARLSFGIGALLSFYFFLKRSASFSTLIFIIAFVLMILSGERKGWLAFMLSACYINFFFEGRIKLTTGFFLRRIVGPALLIIVFFITSSYLSDDIYYEQQQSTFEELPALIANFQENLENRQNIDYTQAFASRSDAVRYYVFMTGIYEFEKDPLFGIGPGNFRKIIIEVSPDPWIRNGAHNEYLNDLVEYGSIGLLLFLILLIFVFRMIKKIRLTDGLRNQHRSFTMALFIYMSVINFFDGGGDAINYVFILLPAALAVGLKMERNHINENV